MEFTFKLKEEEANAILAALQELPAKVANPITQKLLEQAKEQVPPKGPQDLQVNLSSGAETKESFA